ncbi:MAG: hypothetical protein WC518_00580 [Patescibacteria group bacterium]
MFNSLKKKKNSSKEEEGHKKKTESNFAVGIAVGVVVAVIILAIIGALVFVVAQKGKLGKKTGDGLTNTNQAASAAEKAKLRITIVTSKNCQECFDINLLLQALRQNNIEEKGTETLYIEDNATKTLLDKYKITKIPTVLIAGELDKNPNLKSAWPQLGEIIDGVFVFREIIPPYIEVATGQVRGKFSVIFLTDKSCDKCYDINLHNTALTNLGMKPSETKTIDVASDEGKALVKEYGIKAVPTILLQGELSEYQNLSQVWPTVGTVAEDGTYIFTKMDEMGTYKDLTKGKVVEVKPQSATTDQTATPVSQ